MVHPFFFSFPLSGISSLTSLQLPTGRFDISLISLGFSMPAYSLCGFTDDSLSRLAYRVIPVRLWDKINKTKEKKLIFINSQGWLVLTRLKLFYTSTVPTNFSLFCMKIHLAIYFDSFASASICLVSGLTGYRTAFNVYYTTA